MPGVNHLKKKTRLNKRYRNRKLVFDYLKDKTCEECGEDHVACLEFDHLEECDKRHNISELVKNGAPERILFKEIRKCRILCSNCHKKHTAQQQLWYYNLMSEEEQEKYYNATTEETSSPEGS